MILAMDHIDECLTTDALNPRYNCASVAATPTISQLVVVVELRL